MSSAKRTTSMSSRTPAGNITGSTRSSGSGIVGPTLGVKGSFTTQSNKKSSFISATTTAVPPPTSDKAALQKIDLDATVAEEYNEDEENEDGEPKADRSYKYACSGRNVRPFQG